MNSFISYIRAFQMLRPEHAQIVNGGGCVGHYPCRETSGIGPAKRVDELRTVEPQKQTMSDYIDKAFGGYAPLVELPA